MDLTKQQHWAGVPAAPTLDHEKLIGVELTYIAPDGQRAELQMLATDLLLPRRNHPWARGQLQVTLHMTGGDRNAQIPL